MKVTVIGIAGGTSSGKSTLVDRLAGEFSGHVTILSQDAYYRDYGEYTFEERRRLNYDHPDAFELDLMVGAAAALKEGKPADVPIYDFVNFCRKEEVLALEPKPIVLCEGLLVLWYEQLRALCDLKIFIDEDADIRLARRIRRDMEERGRTLDSILEQYQKTVKPMHEQFILPSKRYADIILPEGTDNVAGTAILINHLRSFTGGVKD